MKLFNESLFLNILVLLCCCLSASCGKAKQENIYGTYVANYDLAKETLTLDIDGKFTQEVLLKSNSKIETKNGTWSFNKDTGAITFYGNFMAVKDGHENFNPNYVQPDAGLTILPVTNVMGKLQIEIYEGTSFRKI